jgi:hypothetical protein
MWTGDIRHAGHGFARVWGGFLPATQLPIGLGEFIVASGGIGLQLEPPKQSRFRARILLGLIEHGT